MSGIVDETHRWRSAEEREDVRSEDGTITFNRLQQREVDMTEKPITPLEEAGGTDPNGDLS